jgi:hypothetical protein
VNVLQPSQTPQVNFAVEHFADVWPEADQLTRLHWEEIANNKGLLTLNPDVEKYELLDKSKLSHVKTRRGDLQ